MMPDLTLQDRAFLRGAPGYEEARRATMWNARLPDRYPDVIETRIHVPDPRNKVTVDTAPLQYNE